MSKPQKPNLSFPDHFATTGQKTNFTQEKIENGFDTLQPDVLAGDNLNKFIDDVYRSITYSNTGVADLYKGAVIYDENETYNKNSIIFNPDDDGTVTIYISKVNNNQGNSLTDETKWQEVQLSGGGLEIGDIGTALYIDETKGKRRWLSGSVMSINSNTQGFLNWLKKAVQSVPSIATTETNWQAEASLSVYGQCGKFVIDEENGTIRLPKVVNIQGLQDLTKAGAKVEAGLPSLSLSVSAVGDHQHTLIARRFMGNSSDANAQNNPGWACDTGRIYSDFGKVTTGAGAHSHTITNNNSIYGNSTTVQPEAVQYPYFIQIATGSETEVDVVNEIEFNNPYSLLEVKWSDKKINNLSWLISQGQANSGVVYVDVYNFLMSEYENGTNEYETINGTTINFRKSATTGIKITIDKASYDAILTATGTAWYYVLDGENQVFYLPQTNGFLQGGEGGKFTQAGLPNITGNVVMHNTVGTSAGSNLHSNTGAFNGTVISGRYRDGGNLVSNAYSLANIDLNASRSSSIYGNSNTVQPNSVSGYLYFYVGETVQNANLIDAGRIAEQLPEKLDKSQKQEITGWGFPSTKRTFLTIGATLSEYTAPDDGWFQAVGAATGESYIVLRNQTAAIYSQIFSPNLGFGMYVNLPVRKGQKVQLDYHNVTMQNLIFIYAEGAVPIN